MGNSYENKSNVIYLAKQSNVIKNRGCTSGNKAQATLNIMSHLEKIMIKQGANNEEIMQFEHDFLKDNGIAVPDSFWISRNNVFDNIETFIKDCTKESSNCMSAKDFYNNYILWCNKNCNKALLKSEVFSYLRSKNMIIEKGTVNGRTTHNVIHREMLNEF